MGFGARLIGAFCATTIAIGSAASALANSSIAEMSSADQRLKVTLAPIAPLQIQITNLYRGETVTLKNVELQIVAEPALKLGSQWQVVRQTSQGLLQELVLNRGAQSLEIRLDGHKMAYRHRVTSPTSFRVKDEPTEIEFHPNFVLRAQYHQCGIEPYDCFHSSHENLYVDLKVPNPNDLVHLPTLAYQNQQIVYFTEMDQRTFPALYLRHFDKNKFKFDFPRMPTKIELEPKRWTWERVVERADYLTDVPAGEFVGPWRIFYWGDSPTELLTLNLALEFIERPPASKHNWVEYGFGTDDWIVDTLIDLPHDELGFKPGINTDTYRFYIDFAAHFGLKYIIIDDGWSRSVELDDLNPNVDLEFLKSYARTKSVKLILWVQYASLIHNMSQKLDQLKALGASGLKVDFFDRDDAAILQFQEKLFVETETRQLTLLLHGVSRPSGQDIRYPHIIGFEAGRGHEYNKFGFTVTPEHKLNLALIRALQGGFDWEGAGFRNLWPQDFVLDIPNPFSQGTRASEIAVYLFFESRIQVLGGNLGDYLRNPELTQFLVNIPVQWDERIGISAMLDDHAVRAKRHGVDWFVAGLSGRYSSRDSVHAMEIPLHFLKPGKYRLTGVMDCLEEEALPSCTKSLDQTLEIGGAATASLPIVMLPAGGFILKISPF